MAARLVCTRASLRLSSLRPSVRLQNPLLSKCYNTSCSFPSLSRSKALNGSFQAHSHKLALIRNLASSGEQSQGMKEVRVESVEQEPSKSPTLMTKKELVAEMNKLLLEEGLGPVKSGFIQKTKKQEFVAFVEKLHLAKGLSNRPEFKSFEDLLHFVLDVEAKQIENEVMDCKSETCEYIINVEAENLPVNEIKSHIDASEVSNEIKVSNMKADCDNTKEILSNTVKVSIDTQAYTSKETEIETKAAEQVFTNFSSIENSKFPSPNMSISESWSDVVNEIESVVDKKDKHICNDFKTSVDEKPDAHSDNEFEKEKLITNSKEAPPQQSEQASLGLLIFESIKKLWNSFRGR